MTETTPFAASNTHDDATESRRSFSPPVSHLPLRRERSISLAFRVFSVDAVNSPRRCAATHGDADGLRRTCSVICINNVVYHTCINNGPITKNRKNDRPTTFSFVLRNKVFFSTEPVAGLRSRHRFTIACHRLCDFKTLPTRSTSKALAMIFFTRRPRKSQRKNA